AHHTDRPDCRQHREALPDVAIEARAPDLFGDDRVRVLEDLDALARDRTDDPNRETRPWERLSPHDLARQSEFLTHRADLVLEQVAQRFDQLELHVVGQTTDVVVRLDVRVVGATRLDDVRVQRSLYEKSRVTEVARGFFEHADEQLADRLALALGIDDIVERVEETVGGLHVQEVDRELLTDRLLDLLGLP